MHILLSSVRQTVTLAYHNFTKSLILIKTCFINLQISGKKVLIVLRLAILRVCLEIACRNKSDICTAMLAENIYEVFSGWGLLYLNGFCRNFEVSYLNTNLSCSFLLSKCRLMKRSSVVPAFFYLLTCNCLYISCIIYLPGLKLVNACSLS
jgi:hypothetical protein